MAGTNDINELKSIVRDLVRALKADRAEPRKNRNKYAKYESTAGGLEKSYDELDKQIKHQTELTKDSSNVFAKLKNELQNMLKPMMTLDHAFEEMGKDLKSNMKNAAEDQKKVVSEAFGIFNNVLKTNSKKFQDNLEEMAKSQIDYMKALEKAEQLVNAAPKDNISLHEGQKNAIKSEIASLTGKMKGKSPAEKQSLKKEVDKKKAQLKVIQAEMDEEIKARDAYTQSVIEANETLHKAAAKLSTSTAGTQSLNKITAENLKIGKASAKDFADAREQLKKNSSSVFKAAEKSYDAHSKFLDNKAALAAKVIMGTVSAIVNKSIPQMVNDFKARQYYGGNESLASQNIIANTGMTEAERETLVGKNQTLFRVMGGGDQNAVFKGGRNTEFSRLQKQMQKDFGIYGKEAAERIAEFGTTLMKSGFKPTEQNLKQFSDNIRIVSDVTGEAPDVIKGFYDQLQQTGQMAVLNQAFANKTDAERMDILKNNTLAVFTLNKSMGYTADQIKEQNQRALKREHADLVGSIMQQVGMEGMVQEYNKSNPNKQYSTEDFARGQIIAGNDQAGIATLRNKLKGEGKNDTEIKSLFDRYTSANQDVLATAETQRQKARLASIAGGNVFGSTVSGASASFISDLFGQKGGFSDDQMAAYVAKNVAKGQDSATPGGAEALKGRFAGQDISKLSIDQVNKAADSITEGLNKASRAAQDFATQLESIKGNPVGAAAGGIGSTIKDLALYFTGSKLLKGARNFFGRGAATTAAEAAAGGGEAIAGGGAATTAAEAAAGGGEAIAGGGLGLAGTLAAEVSTLGAGTIGLAAGGAAITGGAIGTGLNKMWDSSKYGDKVNDAINSLASNGIEAAVMKIKAMADPMYSMSLAATPKDKLIAVEAHRSALNYLMESVGKEGLQNWDANKFSNKNIQADIKNGSITFDDLKQAGASDDFIKGLGDSLSGNTNNDKVVELLKKINDTLDKGNTQDKEHAEKQQYYFASKEAIDQRVNRFLKSDADITKMIKAKTASMP